MKFTVSSSTFPRYRRLAAIISLLCYLPSSTWSPLPTSCTRRAAVPWRSRHDTCTATSPPRQLARNLQVGRSATTDRLGIVELHLRLWRTPVRRTQTPTTTYTASPSPDSASSPSIVTRAVDLDDQHYLHSFKPITARTLIFTSIGNDAN